jgi:hypothetical protein
MGAQRCGEGRGQRQSGARNGLRARGRAPGKPTIASPLMEASGMCRRMLSTMAV